MGGLHQLGTEMWLIHHLPKGTAIPETRIELAEVLWKDAGQPAPAAEAAYTDIDTDDTDAQQAAQWAIENELMTLRSSEHPDKFEPPCAGLHRKSHSRVAKGTADETVYQVTPNGIKNSPFYPFFEERAVPLFAQPTQFFALRRPFFVDKAAACYYNNVVKMAFLCGFAAAQHK